MASYTETFLRLAGTSAALLWTVPATKRAVITSMVVCQRGAQPGTVQVIAGNHVIYQKYVAGAQATEAFALRAVVYQGEAIFAFTAWPELSVVISGYLFNDDSGRTGPWAEEGRVIERGASPTPLPAAA